jgi:hypothetical protein
MPDLVVRVGYRFDGASKDLLSGGTDVMVHTIALGGEAGISPSASAQVVLEYDTTKDGSAWGVSRSGFSALAKLRLLVF